MPVNKYFSSVIQYDHMSSTKMAPIKPCIIFLYGFPGAGKTTFARHLADEMKLAHLQRDRISYELYGENSKESEKYSINAMNFMANEFLKAGVSLIYDMEAYRAIDRRKLRKLARDLKTVPLLIWVQIDPDTAFKRVQKRDKRKKDDQYATRYTKDSYRSVITQMQNPTNEEYVVISGKHTYQTQRAAVIKKFYDLGVLNPAQLSKNIAKPELVNLIPQQVSDRGGIIRRNIRIR